MLRQRRFNFRRIDAKPLFKPIAISTATAHPHQKIRQHAEKNYGENKIIN
jgi:hypothetical protein